MLKAALHAQLFYDVKEPEVVDKAYRVLVILQGVE